MSYFICPYCDEELEQPELESPNQDEQYEHECEKCGKNFVFTINFSINYSEEKADCLNGAEHDYQEICGYPEEVFKNRRRCSMCGKEIKIKEEQK